MSHHEEEGSRHGYDAELVAEELRKPTREQIAAVLWKAAMLTPYGLASVSEFLENATPNNLADALLREYEIRVKEEKRDYLLHKSRLLGYPRPKPPIQSGPRGNQMTLIVGIKCNGAVVLGSETEEAAGITAKRSVQKLSRYEAKEWLVVVGGAGDSAIIENAIRRIGHALLKYHCETLDEEQLSDVIDDVLDKVHAKYIDPDPRSDGIALTIGAVLGDEVHLISTHKRTHQFQDKYAYSGIGADLAIYFLDRLQSEDMDWQFGMKLAGFVLHQVKEAAQFCSGESQIYVLQPVPNVRWRFLGSEASTELENYFRRVNFVSELIEALDNLQIHPEKMLGYADEANPEPE